MDVSLPPPLRGINENRAFSEQEADTCVDARNMRSQDPVTKRTRVSQRSGMSKANTTQILASEKVAALAAVIYDARNVTYDFTAGQEAEKWNKQTPSGEECLDGDVDEAGNLYTIDGRAGLVKMNPDGEVVWKFPLPVQDSEDRLRWVTVDDLGDVYTGTSTGRSARTSRMWKLTQLPEDEVEIKWETEPGAWVERGIVVQDKLYTIQNDTRQQTAWVRIYKTLDVVPELAREWRVAHPANDIAVKADGSVLVASDYSPETGTGIALTSQRKAHPRFPQLAPSAEDWTPRDLTDFEDRVWSWYIADEIDELDVTDKFQTGAPIKVWRDISGNDRHLYAGIHPDKRSAAPKLNLAGPNGHATVVFDPKNTGGIVGTALSSLPNTSYQLEYADGQKTPIPQYINRMYATFIVVRMDRTANSGIIFQTFDESSSLGSNLMSNTAFGLGIGGTATAGEVAWTVDGVDGDETSGQASTQDPEHATSSSISDLVLITILEDGGVNSEASASAAYVDNTRSMFNIDGRQGERFESRSQSTGAAAMLQEVTVGKDRAGSSYNFGGEILEWITLDRRDRLDTTFTNPEDLVLTHDAIGTDAGGEDKAAGPQTDTEMARIQGYLQHKYGNQHRLEQATDTYDHFYGLVGTKNTGAGPPLSAFIGASPFTQPSFGAAAYTQAAWACLVKYSPQGKPTWGISQDDVDGISGSNSISCVGYAVAVHSNGNIFTMGPDPSGGVTGTTNRVAYLIDKGETVSSLAADGAWGYNPGSSLDSLGHARPRMDVDKDDNLYVPIFSATNPLRVLKGSDGTLLSDVTLASSQKAYSVQHDPRIPEYDGDLTNDMAERVYVFTDEPSADDPVVHRVDLVTVTPVTGSPRTLQPVGISETGVLKTFTVGGGAPATPTNSSGDTPPLSATADYFHTTTFRERLFVTDGVTDIKVYYPRDSEVTTLISKKGGEPPHRSKILETVFGRLVGARAVGLIDGAYMWTMSREGEFDDWDTFPPDNDPAAAISGNNVRGPGLAPDLINGIIPYNDDLAYFLGDHSIWMLSGDPGENGTFDLVSDEWGGSFGRAWAKDPEGNVYFFGSRGGLFKMPPGGLPVRITRNNIEARLRGVDLGTNYIRMAWNEDDEGLHIFQFPFGAPNSVLLEHWFWDTKNLAPWSDRFGKGTSLSVQPTAAMYLDGDAAGDRMLLLGCEDGYVRKWDSAALDDDGTAIDAFVMQGPLAGRDAQREMRFKGPRVVLATDQNGCRYELYASDEADTPGVMRKQGELLPGRNPMQSTRVRSSYCFVKFRNALAGQRFSIEESALDVRRGGRKRVRSS